MATLSSVLIFLGLALWLGGMFQSSRLNRRFREKKGTDLFPLAEFTSRYLERPWLWFIEAPSATMRLMRINTTPHSDAELEQMRLFARRLYGTGLAPVLDRHRHVLLLLT